MSKRKDVYKLPSADRLRLKRSEMNAMRMLFACATYLREFKDSMGERMECVPYGKERINMSIGQVESLAGDVCGTMPNEQIENIKHTAADMQVRMVPKMTPKSGTVLIPKEQAKKLVDAAQYKCKTACAMSQEESEGCEVRKLMEAIIPLEDYDTLGCPYGEQTVWEN